MIIFTILFAIAMIASFVKFKNNGEKVMLLLFSVFLWATVESILFCIYGSVDFSVGKNSFFIIVAVPLIAVLGALTYGFINSIVFNCYEKKLIDAIEKCQNGMEYVSELENLLVKYYSFFEKDDLFFLNKSYKRRFKELNILISEVLE